MEKTEEPKTAEQINFPQTGAIKVMPRAAGAPRPAKLIAKEQEEAQATPAKPPGWWQLADLAGSLDGVIRAIEASSDVPGHWKEAIKTDLRLRCGAEFNYVSLDAHFFVEKGTATLHYTAVPERKLI